MDMNKYKRDYNFKTNEGKKGMTWLIVLIGIAIAALAYFV